VQDRYGESGNGGASPLVIPGPGALLMAGIVLTFPLLNYPVI